MTNSELRMLEDTFFPVEEIPIPHPLYEHEGYENIPSGYKYIMRSDTTQVIACLTDEYVLVENKKLIEIATPVLEKHNAVLVEANVFGDARTSYKFMFPDMNVDVDGDMVHPQLIIKNSYDGTVAINLIAGAFVVVCSNGLILGIAGEIRTRHLKTDKNIWKIEDIINESITRVDTMVHSEIPKLARVSPVKPEHVVKTIEMFPKMMNDHIIEYTHTHKIDNYWDLLNAATFIATHRMNREAESTHNFEKTLFNNIKKMAKA